MNKVRRARRGPRATGADDVRAAFCAAAAGRLGGDIGAALRRGGAKSSLRVTAIRGVLVEGSAARLELEGGDGERGLVVVVLGVAGPRGRGF